MDPIFPYLPPPSSPLKEAMLGSWVNALRWIGGGALVALVGACALVAMIAAPSWAQLGLMAVAGCWYAVVRHQEAALQGILPGAESAVTANPTDVRAVATLAEIRSLVAQRQTYRRLSKGIAIALGVFWVFGLMALAFRPNPASSWYASAAAEARTAAELSRSLPLAVKAYPKITATNAENTPEDLTPLVRSLPFWPYRRSLVNDPALPLDAVPLGQWDQHVRLWRLKGEPVRFVLEHSAAPVQTDACIRFIASSAVYFETVGTKMGGNELKSASSAVDQGLLERLCKSPKPFAVYFGWPTAP